MVMASEGDSDSPRGIAMGVNKIFLLILVLSGYYVSAVARLDCTFDDKTLCSWTQDKTTLSWKFGAGISANSTGPKQPVGGKGRYIYVSSYEGKQYDNEKLARLQSAVVTSFYPDAACFSFYYHMFGVHVGELRVILVPMKDEKTPLGRQVIWRRRGTQPDKWLQFKDSLNVTGDYRIDIEAEGGSGFVGDIAIDEITLKLGVCPGVELCDFESSLCGWTIEGSSQGRYSWQRGVKLPKGPSQDHTTMTVVGYYLQAVARDGVQAGEKTSLVSPKFDERWGPHCVTFWYYRPGLSTGKISVLARGNDKENLYWATTGNVGKFWHYGQVTLDEIKSVQIVFQAVKGTRDENEMAIDDIEIKKGACGEIADCNFNNNYCSYFLNETSDFAWLLGTGRVVNTQFVDTTLKDNSVENGMYIYADMTSSSLKEDQQAVLMSEILQVPVKAVSCLTFYYYLDGQDSTRLGVGKTILDNTDRDLKYKVQEHYATTEKTGGRWKQKSTHFAGNTGTSYQLYFRVTRGKGPRAFIAVDDISVKEGLCIDYCSSNPCLNDGNCVISGNSFKCVCQRPFFGGRCEEVLDPCTSNPCQNNGICTVKGNSYKCACLTPFFGERCEEDPCTSNPCLFDGNCTVKGNSFKCACQRPFFGDRCEKDPCSSNPCLNDGSCTVIGNGFKCACLIPFFGDRCEADPCTSNPCLNDGKCIVGVNSFKCDCMRHFFGDRCEKVLDPCTSNPCLNDGLCTVKENSFKCACWTPFFGERCEEDPCTSSPCLNDGLCTVKGNGFKCACWTPFFGNRCEEDPCTSNPCLNGGICTIKGNNFKCACLKPYAGDRCEEDICKDDACVHGKCEIIGQYYRCRCDDGFTGLRCEDRIQTKLDKQAFWQIIQTSIMFCMLVLFSMMFCLLLRRKK